MTEESRGACKDRSKLTGEELFRLPFPGAGNQRSCATCHVPEDNFTLTPAHVERVWKKNPKDPLFSAIDADDPTAFPQRYTADPGRAAITGNPYDFEAFDIPTLRGISKTAPYWHNNISATLEEVIELYSDQLLSRFPLLVQPGEKEHGDGPGPQEAMTRQQKDDLVAFLKRL